MTGNKRAGAVVQPRDLDLFRELGVMRVADREMVKIAAGFKSTTRVNERLLKLTRRGFLKRSLAPSDRGGMRAVYALTAVGAAQVDVTAGSFLTTGKVSRSAFLEHQLHTNEIYLQAKFGSYAPSQSFLRWRSFHQNLTAAIPLIPDGYFEIQTEQGIRSHFIEVDLGTESPKALAAKAERYLQLAATGVFHDLFKRSRFQVLLLTTGPRRQTSLRDAIAQVTDKLFWFSTFDQIRSLGLWAPSWQRPTSTELTSLF